MADLASLIINIKALGASKAADDLNKVTNSGKQTEVQSDKLTRSTDNLAKAYSALRTSTAAYVAYSAIKTIAQTGLEFDRMERSLFAATGSMEAARVEMKFLRDETNRVGVNLLSTGKMYAQLTAAAKGTTISQAEVRDIFTSVSEASVVLGLSADDTKGAVRALVQVMSKGKVQAEELRGQLGERFPGAFQAAARAMGLTVAEMSKMLEQGNVISDEFIPKFAAEIRRTYAAAVPEAMESAQAAFARFHNAMAEAENKIAQGGLLDALATAATFTADVTNSLIDQVKTTSEWAAALSTGQISFWEWMTTGADTAAERLKELKAEMNEIETGGEIRMPMPPRPSDKPQKSAGELREEARAAKRAQKEYDTLVAGLRSQEEEVQYSYDERMRILREHTEEGSAEYKKLSEKILEIKQGETQKLKESASSDFTSLVSSLMSEEEVVKASYARRLNIIDDYEAATNKEKDKLRSKAKADMDQQLQDIKDSKNMEFNTIVDSLKSEEERIMDSYNHRKEIIIAATEEASQERRDLLYKLDAELLADQTARLKERVTGMLSGFDQYQEYIGTTHDSIENAVTRSFSSMEDALVEFATTGKVSFSDLANSIIADMVRISVQQSITGPLASMATSFIPGMFSGGSVATSGTGGLANTWSPIGRNANGNVYDNLGMVQAFADGGVVNSPTIFPFADGVGLMGEAGPEAIMPLKRVNGKLGVRAEGGGGTTVSITQNLDLRGATESAIPRLQNASSEIAEMAYSKVRASFARGGELYNLSRG